jgi:hypothetical protein
MAPPDTEQRKRMSDGPKVPIRGAVYGVLAVLCLVAMYVANRKLHDEHQFVIAIGVLGVLAGLFLGKASTARTEFLVAEMSNAALIKEKLIENKSLQELREQYRKDLKEIGEIVKVESNRLFLLQLREARIKESQQKLREIDSIERELQTLKVESTSPQITEIREKFGDILVRVGTGMEDVDLIREFFFSIPFVGQYGYIGYLIARRIVPSLDSRFVAQIRGVIRRLNWTGAEFNVALRVVAWCCAGLIAVLGFIVVKGLDVAWPFLVEAFKR